MSNIELGMFVEDVITGFKGTVTGYVKYITGCDQCLVVPKSDGAKASEAAWYDVQRLRVDETVQRIELDNSKTPGPDKPAPRK